MEVRQSISRIPLASWCQKANQRKGVDKLANRRWSLLDHVTPSKHFDTVLFTRFKRHDSFSVCSTRRIAVYCAFATIPPKSDPLFLARVRKCYILKVRCRQPGTVGLSSRVLWRRLMMKSQCVWTGLPTLSRHSVGTFQGKRAHTQLVRKHSTTVVWARWATVDWSWPKKKCGSGVRELISTLKKKKEEEERKKERKRQIIQARKEPPHALSRLTRHR